MCGIVGFSGPFSSELLAAMSDRVAHRGPDDEGVVMLRAENAPPVGLGHRRLSIIDLSARGHQPMRLHCEACGADRSSVPEQGVWLVYNGETYNFPALRSELEEHGHRFVSQSDSEVLLHLYAAHGPGFLEQLNGIFALALYDGRHSGRPEGIESGDVLLARDGLGVKPLYFAQAGGGVLFGSELKAILASPEVPRDLDLVAIDQYLTYLWAPAPRTPLRAVKKMRPGEALVLRGGAVARTWTFYDLPQAEECRRDGVSLAPGTDVAAQLASKIEAAVRRQLVSDVPVGAFLSGGLDSSAVVAMMRRAEANSPAVAYTMDFQGAKSIEGNLADLPYARQAADYLGVELEIVRAGPEMINELERMLWCLDEPQADPAPINALLICERAANDGLKVLMSGAGGDDLLGGYRRHQALRSERAWSWLPSAARRALAGTSRALQRGAIPGSAMRRPMVRRLAKAFAHAHLDDDARLVAYLEWTPEWRRRALLTPPVQAEIQRQNARNPLLESLTSVRNDTDPLDRMLYIDTKHFLADHNLNYTDKTGMSAGVEVRVPLLDPQVVDLAAAIPSQQKIAGGTLKHVFKKAMEPYLPHQVIYRPKSGFAAPLRRWLHSDLVELRRDVLSERSLTQRGLFAFDEVRRLVEADRGGRVDAAYTLFSLMCIELWCRMFIDGVMPAGGGISAQGAAGAVPNLTRPAV
jgi:asparagine synthase (glutamine-hydrolysing)